MASLRCSAPPQTRIHPPPARQHPEHTHVDDADTQTTVSTGPLTASATSPRGWRPLMFRKHPR
ncbi:hypothetical protein BD626DRAFT_246231 [Schizophyllum amplum]|uniref:Uncharacterized protein n=1 Tax=Schizophyllum amplum TaxID=97359 RepID=A0A550BVL2_9AGAR|nr:hypothetical protein BD626DRAFT_246231 [Auriculariopsis ampla]